MSARHPGCPSLGRSSGVVDAEGLAYCIDCYQTFTPKQSEDDPDTPDWRAGFRAGWSEGRKKLRKSVESRGEPDDATWAVVMEETDEHSTP